jgi:hypothetical protein
MKIQGLRALVERLIESGFVFETRPTRTSKLGRQGLMVEVGDTSPLPGHLGLIESSAREYLEILEYNKISMMLFDASIIQISYIIKRNDVVKHRYCYIPAPCLIDLREIDPGSLVGVVDGAVVSNVLNHPRRAVLRFEYDPAAQAANHPAAHLHVNSNECRLPLRAPLDVQDFVHFLIKYMYTGRFPNAVAPANFSGQPTLSVEEEQGFHLSWRSRAGA